MYRQRSIRYCGITPACAGKTEFQMVERPQEEDHPRVCGKNEKLNTSLRMYLGSPPRVREKLVNELTHWDNGGITPACAGKTLKDPIEITNPD